MMPERILSVGQLLEGGFVEIDCWSSSDDYLTVPMNLPEKRGVYAFVINDQVRYVGLASRSIKQRLGHYARPGPSQTTNIRLNLMMRELIGAGVTVRIFLTHPEDSEWRGFRISGAEGLEAALIEDFDLPWNKRGTSTPATSRKRETANPQDDEEAMKKGRLAHGALSLSILKHISQNPGISELEIARAIYGRNAVQPQVNQHCRKLAEQDLIERRFTRPFSYEIKQAGRLHLQEIGSDF